MSYKAPPTNLEKQDNKTCQEFIERYEEGLLRPDMVSRTRDLFSIPAFRRFVTTNPDQLVNITFEEQAYEAFKAIFTDPALHDLKNFLIANPRQSRAIRSRDTYERAKRLFTEEDMQPSRDFLMANPTIDLLYFIHNQESAERSQAVFANPAMKTFVTRHPEELCHILHADYTFRRTERIFADPKSKSYVEVRSDNLYVFLINESFLKSAMAVANHKDLRLHVLAHPETFYEVALMEDLEKEAFAEKIAANQDGHSSYKQQENPGWVARGIANNTGRERSQSF